MGGCGTAEVTAAMAAAAALMGSARVQRFRDHVPVEDAGTSGPTPGHSDGPCHFVEGRQTVSVWSPLDPVTQAGLRGAAGSSLQRRDGLPARWLAETAFYCNPRARYARARPGGLPVRAWHMQPGDAVAFHFRTLHGTRGNAAATWRAERLGWCPGDALVRTAGGLAPRTPEDIWVSVKGWGGAGGGPGSDQGDPVSGDGEAMDVGAAADGGETVRQGCVPAGVDSSDQVGEGMGPVLHHCAVGLEVELHAVAGAADAVALPGGAERRCQVPGRGRGGEGFGGPLEDRKAVGQGVEHRVGAAFGG